jgi:anhydro-N-acetylmuramic acid kinase
MKLIPLSDEQERLCIGLMSGTSADGIDAALVRISGSGETLRSQELAFVTIPYEEEVRKKLLLVAKGDTGGSHELTLLSFLLGELFTEASLSLCGKAGVKPSDIDLIGSHGHTVYHIPLGEPCLGRNIRGTMQIGDVSSLAETFGCPVVSDFRVRDFAAGGMGAPLVPYTEYLLFRRKERTVALQNIGGIGNVTILPKNCEPSEVVAFDTGPGNMVIDALVSHYTGQRYDDGGMLASKGTVHPVLQEFFASDPYLSLPYPKTTGREMYGEAFVEKILAIAEKEKIQENDVIASATWFSAYSIQKSLSYDGLQRPDTLIVGGGGSHNRTLLCYLRQLLPDVSVVTDEDVGCSSDSKEAVAFAILANECVCGKCNSLPTATGARHPVVLGKIQL